MQSRFLGKRVEILERTVGELNELPTKVEALTVQVSQLRTEMRSEFSAVRSEAAAFREETRKGDEDTRTFARVLHEDTISRIAILAEGNDEQFRVVHENAGTLRAEMNARFDEVTAHLVALGRQLTHRPRKKSR
jgi:hypothetical protein